MITSIADIRRLMQVGATIVVTNHAYPELSGERRVLRAQTKSWELSFPADHPRYSATSGSWLNVPKRTEVTFDGPDTFTITDHDEPLRPFCTITVAS